MDKYNVCVTDIHTIHKSGPFFLRGLLQPTKDFSWDTPVPVTVEVSEYCVDFGPLYGETDDDAVDTKGLWLYDKKESSYYIISSPAESYEACSITDLLRATHLIWLRGEILKRDDLFTVDKKHMLVVPHNIESILEFLKAVRPPNQPLTLEFIKENAEFFMSNLDRSFAQSSAFMKDLKSMLPIAAAPAI